MGNSQGTKPTPTIIIENIEKKVLISWSQETTNKWFEHRLISLQKLSKKQRFKQQLIQSYIDTLCKHFCVDGYGINLMNEEFFIKLSYSIIDQQSKRIGNVTTDTIDDVQSMIKVLFNDHIIRIQQHYNKEYPSTNIVLQNEPNIKYIEEIIASKDSDIQYKLLEWYHYQTEHRLGYASRTQQRIWILQPSTCKKYYGEITSIPLNKFGSLEDLQNKEYTDPISHAILFSHKNKSKILSLNSLSCFIWYSLTLSSCKDSFHNASMPKGAYSKRVNPSSGGLHPVECYFIIPSRILDTKSITNQWLFCHYPVREHALEILGSFHRQSNDDEKQELDNNIFYILVSAVDFREVWKYGERGLRYSMLDVGHGLGSLCIIANLMGWKCQIASNLSFVALQSKFNLPPADHARILLRIECDQDIAPCNDMDILCSNWILNKKEYITECYSELSELWPILGFVEKHCLLTDDDDEKHEDNDVNHKWVECNIHLNLKNNENILSEYCCAPNYALRHRRSALEFTVDKGKFTMFINACFIMKNIDFPFKYLCCYILYVIRIEEVESGLYLLFPKHATKYEDIYKQYLEKSEHNVKIVELMSGDTDDEILRIYQIQPMDEDKIAKMSKDMSCYQNLCANAYFTIDFCVDLDIAIQSGYNYSAHHWECGFIGQLLYVHMECMGLAATAIGCYLDDFASSNVGFLPQPVQLPQEQNDEQKRGKNHLEITPNRLRRFDSWKHPFKNIRSLCHFSCGLPSDDLRYPYYAWEHDLFPFH